MRTLVVLAFLAWVAAGQDYVLESNVLDGGGLRAASADYVCGFSAGQTVASGQLSSAGYRAILGFWNRGFDLIGIREPGLRLSLEPGFRLMPCRPNPVRDRAVVRYAIGTAAHVRLELFDNTGRVVGTLADGPRQPGVYNLTWDVSSVPGSVLPGGVYFLRLSAGDRRAVGKLVLSR